jgi:hypothetical protein
MIAVGEGDLETLASFWHPFRRARSTAVKIAVAFFMS